MIRPTRLAVLACACALLVPALTASPVGASPVDQQRDRVDDIVDELERLEEEAIRLGSEYDDALATKAEVDEEIVEAEARVAAKEAELATLRGHLSEMAVRSFVGGGSSPLGPLFQQSTDLNDVLQREELARVALSAGTATSDELDALVADLEAERASLDAKRTEAEQLAGQIQEQQAATDERTADYQAARQDAEAKLGQLLQEEEERRARESAAQVAAQVAEATANSGGGNPGGGGGGGDAGGGGNGNDSGGGAASGGTNYPPRPVSSRAGIAVNAALGQQGVPYRYASSSPGVAFDCSGLTAYAWGQAGVGLPHQSRAQYASVPHVSKADAQPGDLLFYYSPISHVGIYLGGGQLVHAPNTGKTVSVAAVNWGKVTGVGRPG
jgi:cell wall-associated NlpC family hydrolase